MMWGDGMGWGMGWAWLFWILMIVGVVVLVTLLVLVVSRGGPGRQDGPRTPPAGAAPSRAREILEERYARGEISAEEFQERRRLLEGNGP
ncbi:SHOCT domain-containing protein [Citricoccus sp. SGAir0253]|uniref:SHOCT domain-containing protein n=1 Tax=Citricoccus sp. SGAir0253 TaxID=2567881 RepID=UPI0010CCC442|nr:SHOCT domain-containing protein [Citricoccus sp. SGAir0253]QCU79124.1 SHOCT domain-containing protein [Citricoccus sp. SGAir0253]